MILVDGNNVFAKYTYKLMNLRAEGLPTGGIFGVLRDIGRLARKFNDGTIIVVWDGKDGKERRREVYKEYKKARKPFEQAFFDARAVLQDILTYIDVIQVDMPKYEADDVIGDIAKNTEDKGKILILSADRDFWQLINEHVSIILKDELFGLEEFKQETGCNDGEEYLMCRALSGDTSDKIEGVPGVGPKTALKIVRKGEISKYQDVFDRNIKLMRLGGPVKDLKMKKGIADYKKFVSICLKFKLRTIIEGAEGIIYPNKGSR